MNTFLAASSMASKVNSLWPEIILLFVAFAVMVIGLSPDIKWRKAAYWISLGGLIAAGAMSGVMIWLDKPEVGGVLASAGREMNLSDFTRFATCIVGLLLFMIAAEVPDETGTEPEVNPEKEFNPANTSRGEFYGLMLLSLVGVMVTAAADDLIWLFLALELVSLPTYVMVATARDDIRAPEAGVKYFFLGAFAAAIFLYGFALIYGATGYTEFGAINSDGTVIKDGIVSVLAEQRQNNNGSINTLATLGFVFAVIGVCFKIAAFPMHFYAPDVYQGAATPVSAFLAFVPKAAGFLALMLLLALVGWPLGVTSPGLEAILWGIAALTMFIGNTMALLQDSVKRMLAYSSIAHSGYMLVALLAGPGYETQSAATNGLAAVLYYLLAYGVMNISIFAVVGMMKRNGEEAEKLKDFRGLIARRPVLAILMTVSALSLTGIPPIVGFWGKIYLFGSAVSAGYIWLVVLAVINSAIAAVYYLRLVTICFLPDATVGEARTEIADLPWRLRGAVISVFLMVIMIFASGALVNMSFSSTNQYRTPLGNVEASDKVAPVVPIVPGEDATIPTSLKP